MPMVQFQKTMQAAVAAHQKGAVAQAEGHYKQALALDADNADALRLLGGLYVQAQKWQDAIDVLQRAQAQLPTHAEVLFHLALSLQALGRIAEAQQAYSDLLKQEPRHTGALFNSGYIAQQRGAGDDAIQLYERLLSAQPAHVKALHNLALLYMQSGMAEKALPLLEKALALKPDYADAYNARGSYWRYVGASEKALADYDKALGLTPQASYALNKAVALLDAGRADEAQALYDALLADLPDMREAQWGLALLHLRKGEYEKGWPLYEVGLGQPFMRYGAYPATPRWDGLKISGTLLLIAEQGLGDTLQFVRYAQLAKERAGRVVLAAQKPLVRLLANCPYVDAVVEMASCVSVAHDAHAALMSLPQIFGTTLETVPATIPYVFAKPDEAAVWKTRIENHAGFVKGHKKIGLVWAGAPRKEQAHAHLIDKRRSMHLALLAPLLNASNATFYSLQIGAAATQIAALGGHARIIDFTAHISDFADTAALVDNLDLVISVDTSTAHLAGALGKRVWILSRFDACWRWLNNRRTSPWYPSARIFGQREAGDWVGVVEAVRQELLSVIR